MRLAASLVALHTARGYRSSAGTGGNVNLNLTLS